ncbi:MAG: DDE transposase family protein [Firmicutes bacterium]|nr:DDE transposase family protein [Bacillota bacterium]
MEGQDKESKVVPFSLDAAFFFERGVRFLNRQDLSRALKSFERAVECEPENAVNHCNLAGVLSELGDFEKSNEVLQSVLTELAPEMSECYFYMANNYANLGEYELAEANAVKYLEIDPTGEFAPDVDEMLDLLIHEFGGGEILRESRRKLQETSRERDLPRSLLEEGKFYEASMLLEQEIERQPDIVPARNNLALAKYYLGNMDEAIDITRQVLALDNMNIHALCNLAVFIRHHGSWQEEYKRLIAMLKKLMPLQFDQGYKLATTLGILGEHQAAYHLFMRLIEFGDRHDPSLYFALAAACANLDRLKAARQWLLEVQALDEESGIADHFLREVDAAMNKGERLFLSYGYQLPFHLRTGMPRPAASNGQTFTTLGPWVKDPSIRSSLYFALFNGTRQTKREAFQALAVLGDTESALVLREFVRDPKHGEDLTWNALFVLQQFLNVTGPVEVNFGEKIETVELPVRGIHILAWSATFANVIIDVHEEYLKGYHDLFQPATDIWVRYVTSVYIDPPRITKRDVWVAALDYVVRRSVGRSVPQAVLAQHYGVSVKALSKAAHAISLTI